MQEYKVVFTGPMGAGKTTAIAAISDTAPVVTDVANTDDANNKLLTTVGLDFGTLTLPNGDRIRLFGTPGQKRFDFLWSILATNALGVIILLDNSSDSAFDDLFLYVDSFITHASHLPCVIGVGRTESCTERSIDDYAARLAERKLLIPVIEADVRRRDDVALLIDLLLSQIEAGLMETEHAQQ